MSVRDLACIYASLILYDDGIPVTAKKITTLVKAVNFTMESYWPSLFAKLREKRNIEDHIVNCGYGGGAAVAVAAPAGDSGSDPAAAKEKKKEPKEESDEDMGFSLFD